MLFLSVGHRDGRLYIREYILCTALYYIVQKNLCTHINYMVCSTFRKCNEKRLVRHYDKHTWSERRQRTATKKKKSHTLLVSV